MGKSKKSDGKKPKKKEKKEKNKQTKQLSRNAQNKIRKDSNKPGLKVAAFYNKIKYIDKSSRPSGTSNFVIAKANKIKKNNIIAEDYSILFVLLFTITYDSVYLPEITQYIAKCNRNM